MPVCLRKGRGNYLGVGILSRVHCILWGGSFIFNEDLFIALFLEPCSHCVLTIQFQQKPSLCQSSTFREEHLQGRTYQPKISVSHNGWISVDYFNLILPVQPDHQCLMNFHDIVIQFIFPLQEHDCRSDVQ